MQILNMFEPHPRLVERLGVNEGRQQGERFGVLFYKHTHPINHTHPKQDMLTIVSVCISYVQQKVTIYSAGEDKKGSRTFCHAFEKSTHSPAFVTILR